ncbi:aminodeoxychorismate synthase component I [Dendrosporobacter sp. 1207_IL3150]|uniref:aminodeoxychorismate synthase component I n=1 Tax=Dendrosporobacter sp. 1207_IL3150 TaxID=3084054 RepID=UPI002FDB63EA
MKPLIREIKKAYSAEAVYALFAHENNSVYLDSASDTNKLGRYSFIARDPFLVFTSKDNTVCITNENGKNITSTNPFAELKKLLIRYRTPKISGNPPLAGGVIGYFGYDLGFMLEPKAKGCSQDDLAIPDCYLGFYDTVIIIDHHKNNLYIASTGFPELDPEARRIRAVTRADELERRLAEIQPLNKPQKPIPCGDLTSNFTFDEYSQMITRALEYIEAGDIFQVNLSQRFSAPLSAEPFEIYRYLRNINPAPFASYLNFKEVVIASASPERYLLVQDKDVETRPIKGTRPRGHDKLTDEKFKNELKNSEKDRAELVMIIDLERNDLGKVCEYGSVKVPDLIRIEEYATVFHQVSTVIGRLRDENDIVDLIEASFPGGSITGAPKVRSMQIIEELEPVRRGIYTGSVGYIDFNGDADLNIVIRTIVIKDNRAFFQVGGGIVADSLSTLEYEETLTKAKALMKALGY